MTKADISLLNDSPLRIETYNSIVHAINSYKDEVALTLTKIEMQWLLANGFQLLASEKTIIKL